MYFGLAAVFGPTHSSPFARPNSGSPWWGRSVFRLPTVPRKERDDHRLVHKPAVLYYAPPGSCRPVFRTCVCAMYYNKIYQAWAQSVGASLTEVKAAGETEPVVLFRNAPKRKDVVLLVLLASLSAATRTGMEAVTWRLVGLQREVTYLGWPAMYYHGQVGCGMRAFQARTHALHGNLTSSCSHYCPLSNSNSRRKRGPAGLLASSRPVGKLEQRL